MMDQVFCWDLEHANTTTLAKTFYSYPGGFDSRCVPQGKRELVNVQFVTKDEEEATTNYPTCIDISCDNTAVARSCAVSRNDDDDLFEGQSEGQGTTQPAGSGENDGTFEFENWGRKRQELPLDGNEQSPGRERLCLLRVL